MPTTMMREQTVPVRDEPAVLSELTGRWVSGDQTGGETPFRPSLCARRVITSLVDARQDQTESTYITGAANRHHWALLLLSVLVEDRAGRRPRCFVANRDETLSEQADEVWSTPVPVKRPVAVDLVEDLRNWLQMSFDDIADLIAASRSAVHYWRRKRVDPRPATQRNLYRVHALVRALRSATDPNQVGTILTQTRDADGVSASELLRQGRYDDAETLLRPLIFRVEQQPIQRSHLLIEDEDEIMPPVPSEPAPQAQIVRRARRVIA